MTETQYQLPPTTPDPGFPFRILRVFFSKLSVERAPALPTEIKIEQLAEIRFSVRAEERQYQVDLRLRTPDDAEQPLKIEIETIGIFQFTDEGTPDKATIARFLNSRLMFALFATIAQALALTTTLMAMPPLQIPIPLAFGITDEMINFPEAS